MGQGIFKRRAVGAATAVGLAWVVIGACSQSALADFSRYSVIARDASPCDIALLPSGEAFATWTRVARAGARERIDRGYVAYRSSDGSWSRPREVFERRVVDDSGGRRRAGVYEQCPMLALFKNRQVDLLGRSERWVKGRLKKASGWLMRLDRRLQPITRSSLSGSLLLSRAGIEDSVVTDPGGAALALDAGGVVIYRSPAGRWSKAHRFYSRNLGISPSIAVGPGGEALVGWPEDGAVKLISRPASGQWSAPVTIAPTDGCPSSRTSDETLFVGLAAGGRAAVTWACQARTYGLRASVRASEGAPWTAPQEIETGLPPSDRLTVDVFPLGMTHSPSGRFALVYRRQTAQRDPVNGLQTQARVELVEAEAGAGQSRFGQPSTQIVNPPFVPANRDGMDFRAGSSGVAGMATTSVAFSDGPLTVTGVQIGLRGAGGRWASFSLPHHGFGYPVVTASGSRAAAIWHERSGRFAGRGTVYASVSPLP